MKKSILVVRFIWLYLCLYKPITSLNKWFSIRYIRTKNNFWRFLWLNLRYPRKVTMFFLAVVLWLDKGPADFVDDDICTERVKQSQERS